MTGIDGASAVRLHDRSESVDLGLFDDISSWDGEFFVEWQVADLDEPSLPAEAGEQ